MATITTRSGKGSALTHNEVDTNFTNLNTAKLEDITGESVGSLSDVTITAAATGDFLRHNGTAWVDSVIQNSDITSGMVTQHQGSLSITESQISDLQTYALASHNHTLDSLSNVTITTNSSGEILKWNGTAWVNNTLAEAGIQPAGSYAAASHTHDTSDIISGTFADARIAQSNVTQHQAALSITESQISDLGAYITDISGSPLSQLSDVTITTIASGELLKWNGIAWVNNTLAEAGIQPAGSYLTGNETITLTGDVSGSGTTSISVTVADDSHNHIISNVDGLQTALDGKSSTSHNHTLDSLSNVTITANSTGEILKWNGTAWVNNTLAEAGIQAAGSYLTTATTFGGDVSGTYDAIVVADDSHNHIIGNVDGLQIALDGKSDTGHTHATTDITSGTFADARIAQSNVTQHQAALSITESQISDLKSYTLETSGSFTPQVADASTAGNTATGTFTGSWVRIGNIYHVTISLTNITTAGMTAGNDLFIRNLPVASTTTSIGMMTYNNLSNAMYGQLAPRIDSGTSYMRIVESTSGAEDFTTVADVSSGVTDMNISITYIV